MKLLIVGDLHGNKPKIHFKDFDAIISIGDVCSDKYTRKFYDKWIKSEWVKSKEDQMNFDDYVKKVLKVKKSKLNKFDKMSLEDGRTILKFLCSFGKPVFFIPGNWDQSDGVAGAYDMKDEFKKYKHIIKMFSGRKSNGKLLKGLKNIVDCQLRIRKFNSFNILGYGLCMTPELPKKLKIKDKLKFKKIKKEYLKLLGILENKYSKRNKKFSTIFLSHNVPYNTKLDVIKKKDSPVKGQHYGSVIARDFIKKHKPLLCIGGHMHEHFGKQKVGKTVCINAGFGSKVNTLIDLDEKKGKIRSIKFYPRTYG